MMHYRECADHFGNYSRSDGKRETVNIIPVYILKSDYTRLTDNRKSRQEGEHNAFATGDGAIYAADSALW
jgi:hypothetical protein